MSADLIIAHLNEALDLIEGLEPEELRQRVQDGTGRLFTERRWLAEMLGVDETTRLIDAEDILVEEWDPYEDLIDEFWRMYGERDEEYRGYCQGDFEALCRKMPHQEACDYARWMTKTENAIQRDVVFDGIIDNWGDDNDDE